MVSWFFMQLCLQNKFIHFAIIVNSILATKVSLFTLSIIFYNITKKNYEIENNFKNKK